MKSIPDWENVKPSADFSALPAGGYVAKIVAVTDNEKKEYLDIVFDIAEGPEAGRFSDDWGKEHPYAHHFIRSYKNDAKVLGMFKSFTNAVEESNSGYSWTFKEQTLVGKLIGIVVGYEEYDNDRGERKTRTYVKSLKTVQQIREGDYTVPDLKRLPAVDAPEGFTPMSDDELPF
ncbi:MAG: hypothetical protein KBS75_09235 [Bacteroidales bacterium]|nr:hypothetical protein [Candidatus Equimonas faecalis]